jgi:hypothetical protein
MRTTKCKTCDADMIWATLESGSNCPMDAEAQTLATCDIKGKAAYHLEEQPGGKVNACKFAKDEIGQHTEFHISHFATCGQASEHSKKGKP